MCGGGGEVGGWGFGAGGRGGTGGAGGTGGRGRGGLSFSFSFFCGGGEDGEGVVFAVLGSVRCSNWTGRWGSAYRLRRTYLYMYMYISYRKYSPQI